MFFHIHCGEGFPVFDYAANGFKYNSWSWKGQGRVAEPWAQGPGYDMKHRKKEQLCNSASKPYSMQEPLKCRRDANGVPLHYYAARQNMNRMIAGIKKYRNEH